MPRPKVYDTGADRARAYRERRAAERQRAEEECSELGAAVRQLRHAWLNLPDELRPGDVSHATPVQSVELVTALLVRIAEGRLFDQPKEGAQFAEPGPLPAREVKKQRGGRPGG